jgi:hypothetical protein
VTVLSGVLAPVAPTALGRGNRETRTGGLILRKVKIEIPPILTIGHSTRTWKDFLELLRAHCVKRVIDVRSIPRSRHNPQFNRESLSKKLRAARIGYVHLRKLGGLRHARRDSPNMGWRNSSFRGFADYMQTSEFEAGLNRLMKLAGQKRSVIMCAEAVPWRCHRSLIADALTVRGIRVHHIMSMKRSRVHSLIPFARVQGHRITYPVGNRRGARVPSVGFREKLPNESKNQGLRM